MTKVLTKIWNMKLIIKRNKSLVEYKINKEIKQFLSKYKHEKGIHEHGKQ